MRTPALANRWPGVVLIGAAVVMMVGAAVGFLAPSLSDEPPFVSDDVAAAAAAIAGNPSAWQLANGLILVAGVVTALGLIPITLRYNGRSSTWAWMGLSTYTLAAVFLTVDRLATIQVSTWAAARYPDDLVFTVWEAFDLLGAGLDLAFHVLGFLAVGFYGIAISTPPGSRGIGRPFVLLGAVGVVISVIGAAIPAFVFLSTAALGGVSWRFQESATS